MFTNDQIKLRENGLHVICLIDFNCLKVNSFLLCSLLLLVNNMNVKSISQNAMTFFISREMIFIQWLKNYII